MRRPAALGLAGAGLFVAALDAYVVVTLLPAMMGDVGLTIDRIEQATPVITGFLAGYVVAVPFFGAYSDARGRVPVYMACVGLFGAGSVLTATAGLSDFAGLPWLVAGRFVQGIGGGGLVPLSLALAADLYQGRSRFRALGAVAAFQEAGSVFGPVYGATVAAAAAASGGWRFVFWLNLPLAALCGAGLWLTARPRPGDAAVTPKRSVDWLGAALLGLGLSLVVLAAYPDDPEHRAVNSLFVPAGLGAVAALGAFALVQSRHSEPLVPREMWRSRVVVGVGLANLLVGAALMVALLDVPILGRLVFRLDQLASGLLLTQFLVGVPVGAAVGGWAGARAGARLTAVAGMGVSAAAFLAMSGWHAEELSLHLGPLTQADFALAACGLGFGLVIAPLTSAVLAVTRDQSHGVATGLVVLARTTGMLLGMAGLTAFGLYRFRQILGSPVLNDPDIRTRLRHLDRLVTAAFLQEYREIFLVAAGICLLAAAVSAVAIRAARSAPG